jgi:uncharacterized protein YbaR (Trm112 family)
MMNAQNIFVRQISDNRFPWRFVDFLRCPVDGGEFLAKSDDGSHGEAIVRGSLICQSCHCSFPVIDGILRLFKADQLEQEALHEVQYRDDIRNHSSEEIHLFETSLRSRLEIPQHVTELKLRADSVLLEFACGRGKFTVPFLSTCSKVLAIDFSLASLETLAKRIPSGTEVGLVHADITQLKFKPQSFDRAFSTTPLDSREQRMTMHQIASAALNDDGIYVFSVENYSLRTKLLGNPRLTRYPGEGSLFLRMTHEEAEAEAAPYFSHVKSRPIQIFLPVIKSPWISRLFERVPVFRHFGDLLLVRASKPARIPQIDERTEGNTLFRFLYRALRLPQGY